MIQTEVTANERLSTSSQWAIIMHDEVALVLAVQIRNADAR